MDYKNKNVWITGASSGIGRALAHDFAKEGAKLIISSYDEKELEIVRQECLAFNKNISSVVFDLSKTEEVIKAAKDVLTKFGHIDILVNNGGISQRALVSETEIDIDRKLMEINYFAGITLTKLLLPVMKKNGYGHIAVTSSISGKFGFPLRSAYAASKHAIHGFYETLWAEEKDNNIHVTIVCPGRVQTNISLHAITKDGKAHGEMDQGQAEGITPESCSKQIITAMKKDKVEVLIGKKELLMVHIKRLFPRIFYRIVTKIKPT
jgi:dehydrogenase/reductase SDR family member 7B